MEHKKNSLRGLWFTGKYRKEHLQLWLKQYYFSQVYKKQQNSFWDNYLGQPIVYIEGDLTVNHPDYDEWKECLQGWCKSKSCFEQENSLGGTEWINPKTIAVCSPNSCMEFFGSRSTENGFQIRYCENKPSLTKTKKPLEKRDGSWSPPTKRRKLGRQQQPVMAVVVIKN